MKWVWREVTEWYDGVPLTDAEFEYVEGEPGCEHCEDQGGYVSEDGDIVPCPHCGLGFRDAVANNRAR